MWNTSSFLQGGTSQISTKYDGYGAVLFTLTVGYLLLVAHLRSRRAAHLRSLHPHSVPNCDPHHLAWQLAFVEFPFMFEAGTSLGFFSTFAVPSIAAVLKATRGFECGCQVRYDDTMLLMHEIGEHGCRSARGKAALGRVRSIHARTSGIKRDDMAYTLWVFAFEYAAIPSSPKARCGSLTVAMYLC